MNEKASVLFVLGLALVSVTSAHENDVQPEVTPASSTSRIADHPDSRKYAIEAITVTGTRLASPAESPAQVVIFDRERIDQLGVSNVADALDYLSQQSFSVLEMSNFAGARSVQLRGLGVGTTLVLINGRRTSTSALQGAFGYFDLNTIPLSVVERIEVLSTSASSIYGADAVGGVVNIVLKNIIDKPVINLSYGAAAGGADERQASLAFGVPTGGARASFAFDYFARGSLMGSKREPTANQDFTRFGGPDFRAATTNPANVCSEGAANLPGLDTRCASVPVGSTGVGLTPADFELTAGLTNLDSMQRFISIIPESERYSAAGFGEIDLTSRLTAFAELLYSDRRDVRDLSPPALSNVLVPASNPFNPFGVPVRVRYLLTGIGSRRDVSEAAFVRGVAGLRGSMGSWDWEVSALYVQEDATNRMFNRTNPAAVTAALNSQDVATALNVFQHGHGGSDALLSALVNPPDRSTYGAEARQGSAFVRGPLLNLPAGALEGVVGVEMREEGLDYDALGILLSATRTSRSVFAEAHLPLITESANASLIQELALTAAGRYDDYDDFGGTFNPQIGLVIRPTASVAIKAGWGTSFRAPTLFHAYQPIVSFESFINDPARNNEFVPFTFISGGNRGVKPEESEFFNASLVLTPEFVRGASFAATYWDVSQRVRIVSPGVAILAHEATFPHRIIREPQTPEDVGAGLPGALSSIDMTVLNGGSLDTSGIDLAASASFDTKLGRIGVDLQATWIAAHRSADFPSTPMDDRVGVASSSGTVPDWKGAGTLSWKLGGVSLATTVHFVSSYQDRDYSGAPTGSDVNPPVLVDLNGQISVPDSWTAAPAWARGMVVSAGVQNVFDADAPYSAVGFNVGVDLSQADLRQRFLYIKLSREF